MKPNFFKSEIQKIKNAVCQIKYFDNIEKQDSIGTGILLKNENSEHRLLTCKHILESTDFIEIRNEMDHENNVWAKLEYKIDYDVIYHHPVSNNEIDIGIAKLKKGNYHLALDFNESNFDKNHITETVFDVNVIGYPSTYYENKPTLFTKEPPSRQQKQLDLLIELTILEDSGKENFEIQWPYNPNEQRITKNDLYRNNTVYPKPHGMSGGPIIYNGKIIGITYSTKKVKDFILGQEDRILKMHSMELIYSWIKSNL